MAEFTKLELAKQLGCTKQTIANAIKELDLDTHIKREGKTDYLDEYAASVIADKLSKRFRAPEKAPIVDPYKVLFEQEQKYRSAEAKRYQEQIDELQQRVKQLEADIKDERSKNDTLTAHLIEQAKPRGFFARLLGSGD